MKNQLMLFLFPVLLLAIVATGCKRPSSSKETSAAPYFKTPFQDESQFIVETIVSDVAEQMFYAKFHRLPDEKYFSVTCNEKTNSPVDTPVYECEIRIDPKLAIINSEFNVNGPIWSPEIYRKLGIELASAIGLDAGVPADDEDASLLSKLAQMSPKIIEEQNEKISGALENDFTSSALHEQAALLLGAFAMREHSGEFYDIRLPLSRMTAHLAMAHFLSGGHAYGLNGCMANAILLTLMNNQAAALAQLDSLNTNDPAVAAFVRALKMRCTGDYRIVDGSNGLPVQNIEWFCTYADYVNGPDAWTKLDYEQKQTIDFVRVAFQESHSVEMGHQLLATAIPLETKETETVYEMLHHEPLTRSNWVDALNAMPERCFNRSGGQVHVLVIGWGQWATFFQRQLCHAILQDFDFLQSQWGVPDDAKAFAAEMNNSFAQLRLYPFVRRFICTDEKSYHQSVDDGLKVTIATPQLVPGDCWNYLVYKVDFAPFYLPNSNPHLYDWFRHSPPPGTAYDLNPRLYYPEVRKRSDAAAFFEKLHEIAPYDCRLCNSLMDLKYHEHATYEQAAALYSNVLPYSVTAIWNVAGTATNDPAKYESLLLQGAKITPTFYYRLGWFFANRNEDAKASDYYDRACDADPDTVRVSNAATWRVRHFIKISQIDKARDIAEEAGEVYSAGGLEAQALFFELTTNYARAYDWYSKINERYNESDKLINFCMRYELLTGDTQYDSVFKTDAAKIFPHGIEHVTVGDFSGAPTNGVFIKEENDLLKSTGMKKGDVIVAVYGVRVDNFQQYCYAREWSFDPKLDIIFWNGNAYHEINPDLPGHRFGLNFDDYKP